MNIYAVFKHGVYLHDCGGIFTDLEKAKSEAIRLLSGSGDDYHDFVVIQYELDKPAPEKANSGWSRSQIFNDAGEAVIAYQRRNGEIKEVPGYVG